LPEMKRVFKYIIGICILGLLFVRCTDNANKNSEDTILTENELNKQINVQNFFNTVPASTLIFHLIHETKLNYNPEYANDPTKYKKYTLEKPRALNLGIYGTDLAISGAFNQAQECMLFLKCTNYLAQELGISTAFDENIMNRLEKNKDNRDSTLEIVSQSFKKADNLFCANKRCELSVLMVTGAFVEAMYISGQYISLKMNDTMAVNKLLTVYNQQAEALNYLINLLKTTSFEEDKKIIDKLSTIEQYLQNSNNIENFQKAHQLITELRQEFVNVY
jgi:hypothetical protein